MEIELQIVINTDHHQHRLHNIIIISINNGDLLFFLTTESHAWGLNFVSEEEAKKFLEFCSVCIILNILHVVKINLCMKLQFI